MSPGKWRFVCTILTMYHPSQSFTLFCELIYIYTNVVFTFSWLCDTASPRRMAI